MAIIKKILLHILLVGMGTKLYGTVAKFEFNI